MMGARVHRAGLAAIGVAGLLFVSSSDALAQATTSACKGLSETACKGQGAACMWIAPKKGKQKAYCRKKTKSKK